MSRAARRVSEIKERARARRQTAGSHAEGPRGVWQVRAGRGARCRDRRWVPASTCARVHLCVGRSSAPTETLSCEVSTAVNGTFGQEPTARPHKRVRLLGTSQICYGRAPMCSQTSCAMLPQGHTTPHAPPSVPQSRHTTLSVGYVLIAYVLTNFVCDAAPGTHDSPCSTFCPSVSPHYSLGWLCADRD